MTTTQLEHLAEAGRLRHARAGHAEIAGLMASAEDRLRDAQKEGLSYASRFELAHNAAHALALVALRRMGFRPGRANHVFESLQHTIGMPPEQWAVLVKARERRDLSERDGDLERDDALLAEVITIAEHIHRELLHQLGG